MSSPAKRDVAAAHQAVRDAEQKLAQAKRDAERQFREDLAILCNSYGLTIEATGTECACLDIVELGLRTACAEDFE